MKKTIFFSLTILAFVTVFTISSCTKTVETINIIGNYTLDSYTLNGTDQTTAFKAQYVNYKIDFDGSQNYIETYSMTTVNTTNAGAWVLINNGSDVQLTNRADGSIRVLHIIKITSSTADLTESNGTKEYHLLKN